MSWRGVSAAIAVAGLLLVVAGCAGVRSEARANALTSSVQRFGNLLRWGETDAAMAMLRHVDGTPVAAHPRRLSGVRVTQVVIGDSRVDAEAMSATVQVRLGYYRDADGVLRSWSGEQHWWFSPEDRRWYLDGDFPDLAAAGGER